MVAEVTGGIEFGTCRVLVSEMCEEKALRRGRGFEERGGLSLT